MRVLALEPYYGGSHGAFLDGWIQNSRHDWTLLTYPAHGWKWRMRHSGMSFAEDVKSLAAEGESWDTLFCTNMLPLAEFAGLVSSVVGKLPKVIYFHENQLTYPQNSIDERDVHFGLTNMSSALAANSVWFNSAFHKNDFLEALKNMLKMMKSPRMLDSLEMIRTRAVVQPPGVEPIETVERKDGPIRILWSARWEYDKNPELFFDTVELLEQTQIDFRISVIGQQFRQVPEIFNTARKRFCNRIDKWGYQESREDYESALQDADVVVSTADHEFFGISMVEAVSAGTFPLLPKSLAYPEVFGIKDNLGIFYDGTAHGLSDKLVKLAKMLQADGRLSWCTEAEFASWREKYLWQNRSAEMDEALEEVTCQ